jgi:hypothetical protein
MFMVQSVPDCAVAIHVYGSNEVYQTALLLFMFMVQVNVPVPACAVAIQVYGSK